MDIADLPIPSALKEFYICDNIKSLYPPQADVIRGGLLNNKNMLISIPTASGKTLMAELAMLTSIIKNHGKALYIVPLKALASEKYKRFCKFEGIGQFDGKAITTAKSTGDYRSKSEKLGEADIIVVTSEKADSLIRNKAPWLEYISVAVVDEIHLVDDDDRGATLEMIIAKLRRINPKIQIIGLSATVGNPEEVAKWLKAELVVSEWRPTNLKEGVYHQNAIHFRDTVRAVEPHKDSVNTLVVDMINEGGQCLVFCDSRRVAEGKAKDAMRALHSLVVDTKTQLKLQALSNNIKKKGDSEAVTTLAACVSVGSAFHHAGMVEELREIVETGFKDGAIKVIFCTPTLASGINLPARRVIVQGYKRYSKKFGRQDIPVLEYKQMAGRAGRPHLDPYGECVLVPYADEKEEAVRILNKFSFGVTEDISSHLFGIKPLRIHLLASIDSGFVSTIDDIHQLLNETFLVYLPDGGLFTKEMIDQNVVDAVNYLIEERMVDTTEGVLKATRLGQIVSHLCLDPTTAALMLKGFREIELMRFKPSDVTMLHLLSMTDDMDKERFMKESDDMKNLMFLKAHETELVMFKDLIASKKMRSDDVISPLKITEILREWINETDRGAIAKSWNMGEGDVHSIVESAGRLVNALYKIAQFHGNESFLPVISPLFQRVRYGIKAELIQLCKIKDIGRVRARRLYNSGIRTEKRYHELKEKKPELIRQIIWDKNEYDAVPVTPVVPVLAGKTEHLYRQKSFDDY